MQGIIWLASYPKSGNTWMRAFIANLLHGKQEPVSLVELARICMNEADKDRFRHFFGDSFDYDNDKLVAGLRKQAQSRLAAQAARLNVSVFLKTHSYLGKSCGHETINQDVTLSTIYLVRNPLDIVLSASKHFNLSIDDTIAFMADKKRVSYPNHEVVYEKISDWSSHVKSWTSNAHSGLLVLRYEDMLDSPKQTFRKVVSFIKVDKTGQEIGRAIKFSSFKALKRLESRTGFKEKPDHADAFFRKGRKGQWRNALSKKQISAIVNCHREQMERFGYVPEGY